MSECRWNGSDQPRTIRGRHADPCVMAEHGMEEHCKGCQPCHEPHCVVCRRAHVEGSCAECKAATRETLHEIARMCEALPEEVEHRGIEGEAMMLLGPSADPEARGWVEAAYLSGRLPEGWIEATHGRECPLLTNDACTGCAGSELHPLTVLGTWEMVWRDHLEHESDARITVERAVRYLDLQLHYMADQPDVPFEDFARDLRQCASHLESVLHDGIQLDTGAPCMTCRVPLVREWGRFAAADGWRCPRCREFRSDQDYRLNVADLHRGKATHLTDRDMELRTGVKAGTVRVWAKRGHVERRLDSGRVLYSVADVEAWMSGDRAG